jgi:hypothetical protein
MENDATPNAEDNVFVRLPSQLAKRVRRDANGSHQSVRSYIESALWISQGVVDPVSVKRFADRWKIIDASSVPLPGDEFTYDDKNDALRQADAINSAIADRAKGVSRG